MPTRTDVALALKIAPSLVLAMPLTGPGDNLVNGAIRDIRALA